jgi:hypothetical protein
VTYRPRLGARDLSPAQQARRGLLWRPPTRIQHALRLLAFALAVIGGLLGIWELWIHISSDPINDARAYYEAAKRLNEGRPLYPAGVDPSTNQAYLYPPLLAVVLRPFALLPYYVFAVAWEIVVVGTLFLLVRQLGGGARVWTAIGILGIPIGWAIGVGQAHVPMTLLLAIGQPWSVALAANIKLFPALIVLWWIGRKDWESVVAFAGWAFVIGVVQLLLEPAGTLAFLQGGVGLDQLGQVRNISPFVWASPLAWSAFLLVGVLVTIALARTRYGWAAAVTLATLAPPRLLVYMLTGLVAGVRQPRIAGETVPDPRRVPTAAEAYVSSAR